MNAFGNVFAYCACGKMFSATGMKVEEATTRINNFWYEHHGPDCHPVTGQEFWENQWRKRQERGQCVPS